MDEPPNRNDANQENELGEASFDSVMRALRLWQAHGVEYNILITAITVRGNHSLESHRFLRDEIGHELDPVPPHQFGRG